ncbi:hypothetical protein HGRIS_000281 [Hohenbuehelia grisea]|uniref:Uncharacterized protein n=1 Tax=Hohenbuehelia grisea TaxID=104357 RepID=A0ABR3JQS1_9AGAR
MKSMFSALVVFTLLAVGSALPAELAPPKGNPKPPMEAPVTLETKVDKAWDAMANHVLKGDGPKGNDDAGRHTLSSWQEKNKDEGWCHKETHICAFRLKNQVPKTIWDNRKGRFTDADVTTMCKEVIKLGFQALGQKPSNNVSFVIKTKDQKKICVQYQVAGDGSCYPLTLNHRAEAVGTPCQSTTKIEAQVPDAVREIISASK